LARQSDGFVDIGAHVGYFTFFVRARIDASKPIYFFEPDPELFEIIEQNVRSNSLVNVHGFREAVGASNQPTATFYKNLSDSSSGSLETTFQIKHHVEPIEVSVTTYTAFAARVGLRNACVKVDVEGAEQQFIDGARASIGSISSLIMEVLGPAVEAAFVQHMMSGTGYAAYYINDYALEYSPDGSFVYSPPQYNWLFCRDNPTQLRARLAGTRFRVHAR
jgi:FkbM family methyltransferase